jgi:hypothetical protein
LALARRNGIGEVERVVRIDAETIDIINARTGGEATKVINLIKSIEKIAADESEDPFLIAMASPSSSTGHCSTRKSAIPKRSAARSRGRSWNFRTGRRAMPHCESFAKRSPLPSTLNQRNSTG